MAPTDWTFPAGLVGKNSNVTSFTVLRQQGARPHYSHQDNGAEVAFDAFGADGYSHGYVMNTAGTILRTLTDAGVTPSLAGKAPQRATGNFQFSNDDAYLVYIAETDKHFADSTQANMGIGLYCNLWACRRDATQHWPLTNIPIMDSTTAGATANYGCVNPRFSEDGKYLVWTQHYGDDPRSLGWGLWQVMFALWDTSSGYPRLVNPRPLYTPTIAAVTDPYGLQTTLQNNYITAMAMYGSPSTKLLFASNILPVCAYGMDQVTYDLSTTALSNLTNDARYWMEMGCISPQPNSSTAARNLVYMSNEIMPLSFNGASLDNANPDWTNQPRQREWFYRKVNDGSGKTQLTYFNDYTAPEYVGRRTATVNATIAPDGLSMVGTLAIDWDAGAAYDATTHLPSNVYPNVSISLKLVRLTFASAL